MSKWENIATTICMFIVGGFIAYMIISYDAVPVVFGLIVGYLHAKLFDD